MNLRSSFLKRLLFTGNLLWVTITVVWMVHYEKKHHKKADPVWYSEELKQLKKEFEGFIVFERLGEEHLGIWRQELGTDEVTCLSPLGRYPRLSKDGKRMYFLVGDACLCEYNLEKQFSKVLLQWPTRIPAITLHPQKEELYFISGSDIYCYDLNTSNVVMIESSPKPLGAVDVDTSGDLVISTYEGAVRQIWKQHPDDREHAVWNLVDRGCSAAISPNGRFFTDNANTHKYMDVRSFDNDEVLYRIETYPEKYLVDNETWTNLEEWMIFISQNRSRRYVWLYQMGDERPVRVSFTGDADRPDGFITRVKHPGVSTTPQADAGLRNS